MTPVPAGAKVRARSAIAPARAIAGGGQGGLATTIALGGATKPAWVIKSITRYPA